MFSCYLEGGGSVRYDIEAAQGGYLYVLEGGPVGLNGRGLPALAAAQITGPEEIAVAAEKPAELLLVEVALG